MYFTVGFMFQRQTILECFFAITQFATLRSAQFVESLIIIDKVCQASDCAVPGQYQQGTISENFSR